MAVEGTTVTASGTGTGISEVILDRLDRQAQAIDRSKVAVVEIVAAYAAEGLFTNKQPMQDWQGQPVLTDEGKPVMEKWAYHQLMTNGILMTAEYQARGMRIVHQLQPELVDGMVVGKTRKIWIVGRVDERHGAPPDRTMRMLSRQLDKGDVAPLPSLPIYVDRTGLRLVVDSDRLADDAVALLNQGDGWLFHHPLVGRACQQLLADGHLPLLDRDRLQDAAGDADTNSICNAVENEAVVNCMNRTRSCSYYPARYVASLDGVPVDRLFVRTGTLTIPAPVVKAGILDIDFRCPLDRK